MAMIKCKECRAEVSSKAETCPKCGLQLKAKPSGCIVGFFKIIVGIFCLLIVISFLLSNDNRDPFQELENQCRALADSFPIANERSDFYSNCVSSGRAALNSRGVN